MWLLGALIAGAAVFFSVGLNESARKRAAEREAEGKPPHDYT
jgi:hypothetical protein